MNFKSAFTDLHGREPSADDVLRFERLCKALNKPPTDALLVVLVALDYYQTLYETIPDKINKSATDALNKLKETADKQISAASEQVKADLSKTVADAAQQVAVNASRKEMWKWLLGCILGSSVAICTLLWYAHTSAFNAGYAAGKAAGYDEAKVEKATIKDPIRQKKR